ncbi:MAG: restriction endonuclease subunit S [Veillonella sp.]|uniref:restriction endonuclease subunit S n=1 Tax=Veillonella sp. TaxID=1926307 RepID=UPI0029109905|nr:restriction endonuclease subunit S [Veillonella sp.]MDU5098338.1 restriction endonuclease subunit S [Veillonella sp.]
MSKEKRRVPKLRFPGFTEDWEQRKLDDIAKIKTGGGTPKTTNLEYWSGDIPWIQSSDLVEGDVVHVNIKKFINNNALKNSAAKLISRDSIALVTRVGVGKVAVINQDFTTSQDFLSLSGFDGNDIKFIAYQLFRLMQENAKVLQGTSIKGITKTDLIEQSIAIPNSIKEQSLIANILSQTDSIITLHQRKLNNLKLKKKALLQKLFPKNGERYPELRFPGFTDAWEQRKLGDIATLSKGNGYSKSDLSASGNPIILYGRLYTNYETTIRNVDTFVKLKDKSVISQGGEVIVPASGETAEDISRASVVKNQGVIIGGDLNVIKVNILLDPTFLALTISNREQQKELSKRAQGKSVVHLHNSDLQEVNLIFPLLNEQRKISTLFEKMDNIITLHQRKLDHLQLQKKALLQQMFV